MYEQIFISGVWHSGTSLIAEIAKLNGNVDNFVTKSTKKAIKDKYD